MYNTIKGIRKYWILQITSNSSEKNSLWNLSVTWRSHYDEGLLSQEVYREWKYNNVRYSIPLTLRDVKNTEIIMMCIHMKGTLTDKDIIPGQTDKLSLGWPCWLIVRSRIEIQKKISDLQQGVCLQPVY